MSDRQELLSDEQIIDTLDWMTVEANMYQGEAFASGRASLLERIGHAAQAIKRSLEAK